MIERERKVRLRKKDNRQKSYEIRRDARRGDEPRPTKGQGQEYPIYYSRCAVVWNNT